MWPTASTVGAIQTNAFGFALSFVVSVQCPVEIFNGAALHKGTECQVAAGSFANYSTVKGGGHGC